jgi:hypothetical protein
MISASSQRRARSRAAAFRARFQACFVRPFLCRFACVLGFVILRQTFVRRRRLGRTAKRVAPFLKERDVITVRDAVAAAAGRRILGAFRRCGAVIP